MNKAALTTTSVATPAQDRPIQPPVDGAAGQIVGVQYLRGFAALAVVVYHLSQRWESFAGVPALETLRSGVDVFFVISGFVMVWSTNAGARLSARDFMARRIIRIVPLYWVVTTLVLVALLVAPAAIWWTGTYPLHTIGSFLFLPLENPRIGAIYPVVPLGWTLLFEMFFYLCFALAIMLGRREPKRVMTILIASMVGFVLLGQLVQLPEALDFYARPILLEFVFGMIAGLLVRRFVGPQWPWLALAIFSLAALIFLPDMPNSWRALRFGVPAVLLVHAAIHVAGWNSGFWHRMGDMSYSLYLAHYPVVMGLAALWTASLPSTSPIAYAGFLALGCLLSVAAGYACWLLVERPLVKAGRAHLSSKNP